MAAGERKECPSSWRSRERPRGHGRRCGVEERWGEEPHCVHPPGEEHLRGHEGAGRLRGLDPRRHRLQNIDEVPRAGSSDGSRDIAASAAAVPCHSVLPHWPRRDQSPHYDRRAGPHCGPDRGVLGDLRPLQHRRERLHHHGAVAGRVEGLGLPHPGRRALQGHGQEQ